MNKFYDIGINICSYLISISMTKEILQIIALCFSILGTIIISVFKLLDWYKRASEDGKITSDEIKEAEEIIKDTKEDLDKKTKE